MKPQDVIRKKRDGAELSADEIDYFVSGVVNGEMADYQAAALLMAVYLNGMSESERQRLTMAMLHSGEVLDFSAIPRPKVDKHSTGGVGDKTSLLIAPIAAAAGLCVPMISGRGLGHTGGTLDKLEAIPGFRVRLSLSEFRSVLERVGFAMIGQTMELAPADRKLYALRDATATIEALPLIVASIMSKKLAAGLDGLVLDVKLGSGAFMRDEQRARQLARALVTTGNLCRVRTEALITDMNQPLGRAVGNALETKECLELLRGEVTTLTRPVLDLSLELAARMVRLGGLEESLEKSRARVTRALETGEALEKFRLDVEAQGGDARVCDDPGRLQDLKLASIPVESTRAGFLRQIETAEIGYAVSGLGGGRRSIEDEIDPAVGFLANVRIGDHVERGDPLGVVMARTPDAGLAAAHRIRDACSIGDEPPAELAKLIREVIV